MGWTRDITRLMKRYRKGFLVGGIVGLLAFLYARSQGLLIAPERKALADAVLSRSVEASTMIDIKVAATLIILGALAGYILSVVFGFDKKARRVVRRARRKRPARRQR